MKNKITSVIDRYVFELWIGIILFGLVCELGVFLADNKASYTVCLLVGIITALIAAYHMWWSIDRSFDYGADAAKKMSIQFIIRYLFFVIVLGIMGMLYGAYVLISFLGLLSIKASAYMEPFTKKMSIRIYGEEILPPVIEYLYDERKSTTNKE